MTITTQVPAVFAFNELSIHAFADQQGEPWFLANDVCAALGYRNPRDAIAKHCRAGGVAKRDTPTSSSNQEMTFINEGNLYRLIIKSRKPEAEKFEQLVMEEILPTIRKTGTYTAPQPATLSPAQQRHIQNRVAELANAPGTTFAAVYRSIKDQFKVGTYKDVPETSYPALCAFLLCPPLEGEVLEPATPPTGTFISDHDLYTVWFLMRQFTNLNDVFQRRNMKAALKALGSPAGVEMAEHFGAGSSAVLTLSRHLPAMQAAEHRMGLNQPH